MVVGGQFLQIEAAKRQVGLAHSLAVLIHRYDLQKPVCRDDGTVCCGDVLLGVKSKGHGGDLAVHANTKGFILLQHLVQRHKGFLALVVEAGGSFGDLYLLACIHQLHLGGILAGVRHAVGELDLLHLETPQVERLALGCSILPGGDGIHHFARRVAQGAIQRVDVLQGRDLEYGSRKALHFIHRLVNALIFCHRGEHLAGFADLDDSFLGHVRLGDFDHRHAAFLAGSVLRHIKIHRGAVQYIAIGGLHLHQRIAGTVLQLFRGDKVALGIGVKGINRGGRGISEGHFHFTSVRAVDLEASARIGDGDAGFCVHLDYFDIAFKSCIVDEIAVGLPVLGDIHLKVIHQFPALPAFGLVDDISAVGQLLRLRKTVFITNENIALGFLGRVIAACSFQIDLELRAFLRGFNLGFPIVRMLDDGNIPFDDLLRHIIGGIIQLNGV